MVRAVALALLLLVVTAAEAQATAFRVVVVPGLTLDDIPALAQRGAVGLLVPGTGPETSAAAARAALVRGKVTNSLRGITTGPRLISFETRASVPDGAAIVLGLPSGGTQANTRRYPVAVLGAGYEGLLTSDSTRILGLVSIVDIAPTALEGGAALGSQPAADAAAELRSLDARIDSNNVSRIPATFLTVVLVLALAVVWPRAGLLGFAAALAANLALGLAGVSAIWAVLPALGFAIVVGGPLLAFFLRSDLGAGSLLAAVLLAYLVALGADGPAVALSPFGPAQNGRFYGITNLLETMLLVPALAGATFLARRFGPAAFVVVALAAFVAVAGNRFGADGGGAIVLAAAFGVLGALLAGKRVGVLVVAVAAALALAAGLVVLDAATGGSSHVTDALRSGPGGLASDLRGRIQLSWARITHQPFIAATVAVGLTILVALVIRLLRSDFPLRRRALPLAFASAIAVSLVVNDSPNDVVLAGLVGYVAVERVMLRGRCAAASCLGSPWAFSWPAAADRRLSRPRPKP